MKQGIMGTNIALTVELAPQMRRVFDQAEEQFPRRCPWGRYHENWETGAGFLLHLESCVTILTVLWRRGAARGREARNARARKIHSSEPAGNA